MPITEFYVKLVTTFPRDPKVRALARYGVDGVLARDLYVQMILYCRENLSDGFVPAEEVGVLAYPVPADHANQLAKQLASVGLTKEVSKNEAPGWEVLGYLKRNPSKADVEALSKVRAEAGRTGGKTTKKPAQRARKATSKQVANQDGNQTSSNSVSVSVFKTKTETETEDQKLNAGAERADVERLCAHLADRIESNGAGRPEINKKWRDAARLMLDRDGRTEEQVRDAIDWCQDSEFWHTNILSMPKLREQYERLRLQAKAERDKRNGDRSGNYPRRGGASDPLTDQKYGPGSTIL